MKVLSLSKFLIALLFLLMVALTNVSQGIKLSLLLIIVILATFVYLKRGGLFDKQLLGMTIIVMTVGVFGVLVGAINSTPGFLFYIPLTIVYPFLLLYLSPLYTSFSVKDVDRYIIYLSIVNASISLCFVFFVLILNMQVAQEVYRSIYGGVAYISHYEGENVKFMLPVIDFFVFSFPYLIISSIIKPEHENGNNLRLLALGLSCIVVLLSGRRAILLFSTLICIFSLFIALVFYPSKKVKISILKYGTSILLLSALFLALLSYFEFVNVVFLYDVILSSLNFSSNESNLERVYQFKALFKGFVDNFYIGAGFGAVADYERSEKGWQYELQYLAWLFHGGIVVTMSYALTLLFLLTKSIKLSFANKSSNCYVLFIIIMSCTVVFLSNATNPYLSKFDMMWVFALLIYCFIQSKHENQNDHF